MKKKDNLVILLGPTAIGKTSTSIELAKSLNGEIISSDSMQIYKYMDIGSAKILNKEKKGIPHYIVDLIDIDEVTGIQISPEHKAIHDKVIKKLGLARLDKKADAAAKADMAKEGKAAIEQLVEAATEPAKETKSKKSKTKKESEQ